MPDERLRRHIARIAAEMMYWRMESEYFTAKRKAARQLGIDHRFHPKDLPSNCEIRDYVQELAELYEGPKRQDDLRAMRCAALRLMRGLARFRPVLIGSVFTGHVRKGSDIDIHLFSNQVSAITMTLEGLGLSYRVEQKRILKHNEQRIYTHIHIPDKFDYELTVYPEDKIGYAFKSSITGKTMEKATLPQFEQFFQEEYPDHSEKESETDETGGPLRAEVDRFEVYRYLLQSLQSVKQNARYHPEGDGLYHSLQVFELAREIRSWDEEFLLAALLHDVGKAIDPDDHVAAGLQALEEWISPRTYFLIAHHMDAHLHKDGKLGHRALLRLRRSEDFSDLMLLEELDRKGRHPGMMVCEVKEALDYIRTLDDGSAWA